jgi:hypothetical protein
MLMKIKQKRIPKRVSCTKCILDWNARSGVPSARGSVLRFLFTRASVEVYLVSLKSQGRRGWKLCRKYPPDWVLEAHFHHMVFGIHTHFYDTLGNSILIAQS